MANKDLFILHVIDLAKEGANASTNSPIIIDQVLVKFMNVVPSDGLAPLGSNNMII